MLQNKRQLFVITCSVSWKKYCILNQLHRLFTEFELEHFQ